MNVGRHVGKPYCVEAVEHVHHLVESHRDFDHAKQLIVIAFGVVFDLKCRLDNIFEFYMDVWDSFDKHRRDLGVVGQKLGYLHLIPRVNTVKVCNSLYVSRH